MSWAGKSNAPIWNSTRSKYGISSGFLSFLPLFYLVAVGMYTIVTRWNLLQDAEPDGGKAAFRYWLCMFALLLVCWMPSYLTFYPGCVTPDSAASIDQALGTAWENTHPVLFTLLVTPFMRFGSAVGNLTLGVALFSLFQMLLLAGILAYGLTWLRRKRIRKVGICFVGLYFIVSQVFPLYAISMWKDVLFGAVVLLLTLCLYDIWESKGGELLHAKGLLKFVILCLLTCFMRNNGVYVTFVLLIIMAIYYRRYFKRLAPVFAAVMAAVVLIQGPLYTAIGIRPSPFQGSGGGSPATGRAHSGDGRKNDRRAARVSEPPPSAGGIRQLYAVYGRQHQRARPFRPGILQPDKRRIHEGMGRDAVPQISSITSKPI